MQTSMVIFIRNGKGRGDRGEMRRKKDRETSIKGGGKNGKGGPE